MLSRSHFAAVAIDTILCFFFRVIFFLYFWYFHSCLFYFVLYILVANKKYVSQYFFWFRWEQLFEYRK